MRASQRAWKTGSSGSTWFADAFAIELEEMCARLGADDVKSLDDAEVDELRIALISYERARSQERHDLYETLDPLSAELVRRYREGEAHVDRLLDED